MANRNEYYIPENSSTVKPIDWTSLIGGLTERYETIKKARQTEREELDALVDTNNKILQATQLGKSPNVNEFILRGTESGRNKMNEWNKLLKSGQLSPSEYKKRINNLMDNWNQLAITTKTYDERMQEIFKNQQPDENGVVKGSALELERANELAQYQDLKNKTLMFDDQTGKIFLAKLNNDGILDPTSVTDPRALNNFSNILDNKVQLASLVDAGTKGWKSFNIEDGSTTIDDIRQNKDAYAKAKATLINGILSNDNAKASVLTDYTIDEYDYYLNNDDFLSRVQKRVETENYARSLNNKPAMTKDEVNKFIESQRSKFILLQHDDQGILQPILTKDQDEAARKVVDAEIEIRMGKEVSRDEPQYRSSGGDGGEKKEESNEENTVMIAGYKATLRAFGADPDATISSGNWVKSSSGPDYGGLKQGYTYTPRKGGGLDVYRGQDLVFTAKTPKDLAQYVYNAEPAKASVKWESARKMVRGGGSSKGSSSDPLGLGIR